MRFRGMRRTGFLRTSGRCALLLVTPALVLTAVPVSAAVPDPVPAGGGIPTNWVHHAEAPWSWWAPPRWVNSHGANDLNISSPTGVLWAKFGFSEAPVLVPGGTPGQNAAAWFNYASGILRGTGDMYGLGLTSMRYTGSSAINELAPVIPGYSDDFRVRLTYVGRAVTGARIRGELVMDYVESSFGDIGIETYKARATPRGAFNAAIGTLRTIHRFVAYTGSLT